MSDRPETSIAAHLAPGSAPAARRVCGLFHEHERLEEAVSWLEGSLFVRADMCAVCESPDRREDASGPSGAATADGGGRGTGARDPGHARILADLAAEGLAVLTGAAASAAAAAAAPAGGGAVSPVHAPCAPAAPGGEAGMDRAADAGGVILAVRADRPCEAERAERILRMAGATRIWAQDRPAGAAS